MSEFRESGGGAAARVVLGAVDAAGSLTSEGEPPRAEFAVLAALSPEGDAALFRTDRSGRPLSEEEALAVLEAVRRCVAGGLN
jgi:hypothetical protein